MREQFHCALLMPFFYLGMFLPLAQAQPLDVIQFSSAYYSVLENAGPVAIQVQRAGAMTDHASFTLRTAPQSAGSNDFRSLAQTVTLAPGESNVMVSLEIFNDALAEGYEVFEVILSDPDPFCCQLGPIARATIEIRDNDMGVYFGTYASYVDENVGELQLEVFRVGDMTNMPGSIRFEIEERSAKQGIDFTIPTNRVSFLAGQTNAVIRVLILNDALIESGEQFILKFEPNPDPSCCSLGYPRTAEVWINDNDRGVEFSASSRNVREDAGVIELVLGREGELIAEEGYVTVKVFTNGLSPAAIPGLDFASPANFLVYFAAGQTNASFSIALLNDTLVEDQEKFGLSILGNASTLTLGSYQTTSYVYIDDNDLGVEFMPPLYITREGEHPGQPILIEISVQRVGDPTNEFSVDLEVEANATAGADFILPTNRLLFPSGQSNVVTFVLTVLDDPLVESNEYIRLSITNATGGVPIGRQSTAILVIYDNEYPSTVGDPSAPSFWLSTNSLYAPENATNASIMILRGGNSSAPLAVDFSAAGEATPGLDFVPASGTVIFQPLEISKAMVFEPVDDCRAETNKSAHISLMNPSPGAALSEPADATLLIVDDEAPGSLEGFNPTLQGDYYFTSPTMVLQPDGKIVINGNGVIQRVHPDGSPDASFLPSASPCASGGYSWSCEWICGPGPMLRQPDGKILAAGPGSIIRLNADGTLDTSFSVVGEYQWSSGEHGGVCPATFNSMLLQPDGKIFVQGTFNTINSHGRGGLVRLHPDSTVDTNFMPGASIIGDGRAALQADGKLLIAGWTWVYRLNLDDTRDTNFNVTANAAILGLAVLPNQQILIGGVFTAVNNVARCGLARINADGSLDTNFNPCIMIEEAPLMSVHAITVSSNGTIFVAGPVNDGSSRVVQIDADGAQISSFNTGLQFGAPYQSQIHSVIEQPYDGKLLVAGVFSVVNGIPRLGIARLKSERSHIHLSPPSLQPDGSLRIITGSHVGSTYVLQSSTDLMAWTDVSTNIATDCAVTFEDPNPAAASFYRVVKLDH